MDTKLWVKGQQDRLTKEITALEKQVAGTAKPAAAASIQQAIAERGAISALLTQALEAGYTDIGCGMVYKSTGRRVLSVEVALPTCGCPAKETQEQSTLVYETDNAALVWRVRCCANHVEDANDRVGAEHDKWIDGLAEKARVARKTRKAVEQTR